MPFWAESVALPPLAWYVPQPVVPLSNVEFVIRFFVSAAAGIAARLPALSTAAQKTARQRRNTFIRILFPHFLIWSYAVSCVPKELHQNGLFFHRFHCFYFSTLCTEIIPFFMTKVVTS